MALSQGGAAFAAPDFMLCFHRDGHVQVEIFELLCCRSEEENSKPSTSTCPDENCQDLPIVESSSIVSPELGPALDVGSSILVSVLPAASDPSVLPVAPDLQRPRSFSGPPPPGPERYLRTVVLRR